MDNIPVGRQLSKDLVVSNRAPLDADKNKTVMA
jgi:hypothetical protein